MNTLKMGSGLLRSNCAIWGIEITPCTKSEFLDKVALLAASDERNLVLGHNLHSAFLYHSDPIFSEVYDSASLILCDGAPIQFDAVISQLGKSKRSRIQRMGSTDWLPSFLSSIKGLRVAVIGGAEEVNHRFLSTQLSHLHKSDIFGFSGEGWNLESERKMILQLQKFKPNVVLVGLGMPLQEHLIHRNFIHLPSSLYVLVGGALDQLVGEQALAPRWLGPIGLEWLWRLASQPKRLGFRYLVEPWKLVALRIRQLLRR